MALTLRAVTKRCVRPISAAATTARATTMPAQLPRPATRLALPLPRPRALLPERPTARLQLRPLLLTPTTLRLPPCPRRTLVTAITTITRTTNQALPSERPLRPAPMAHRTKDASATMLLLRTMALPMHLAMVAATMAVTAATPNSLTAPVVAATAAAAIKANNLTARATETVAATRASRPARDSQVLHRLKVQAAARMRQRVAAARVAVAELRLRRLPEI